MKSIYSFPLIALLWTICGISHASAQDTTETSMCRVTMEYGSSMQGCVASIRDNTADKWFWPDDIIDNTIEVAENSNLKFNFVRDEYTVTSVSLNGKDISSDIVTSSFDKTQTLTLTVTEPDNIIRIEGTAKVYSNVDFIGYIVNGEGLDLFESYGGPSMEMPEGEQINDDIVITDKTVNPAITMTMPADKTKKYTITVSEKTGKFFFAPKEGYYISSIYIKDGNTFEAKSSSSSMLYTIEKEFYMFIDKLPEAYTADMTITGSDFPLRIKTSSVLDMSWGNPSGSRFSANEGESTLSFLPGYDTPIIFSFSQTENRQPAFYLDGAELKGTVSSESNALEFFITPYYPEDDNTRAESLHSSIVIYNSFTDRPSMSGASLELEDETEAEFFYSPLLHVANPEGQPVISGTQFTVRPLTPDVIVSYKDKTVELNEDGEYVFNATGNARNNVVKISLNNTSYIKRIDSGKDKGHVTVYSIDGKVVLDNAPSYRLKDLDKGLYILNGRKIVL